MILQRVRQVLYALRARRTDADEQFIASWLKPAEQTLFYAQALADQYHALRTAYTAESLARQNAAVQLPLLLRCALLHDIGRVRGDLGTAGKIMTVFLHAVCPRWVCQRGAVDGVPGSLQHKLYIYQHHAMLGATKLEKLGLHREAVIIAAHHQPAKEDDPLELVLLRRADALN